MTSSLPIPSPALRPIIVGGGNAGLTAAARFAMHGIDVTLLEKQDELGGQLLLSGGAFSAAGTARQRAADISDSAQLHEAEVMRIGHNLASPELVALATRHAATAIDWLDELGFRFDPSTPAIVLGHEPYSVPRTYWGVHPQNGARAILEVLAPLVEQSPHVDVRLSHRVTGIELSDTAVRGVQVATPDGSVFLEADLIIFATGGYAAARDLLTQLQPGREMALLGCLPHATGDALRMLLPLGARVRGAEHFLPSMGMIEDPSQPGVAKRLSDARVIVDANSRTPWEIWVNDEGRRFVDEGTLSPDLRERALLEQPGLAFWSIWTESALEQAPVPPIGPDWTADRIRREANVNGWLHRADSVEHLAALTDLPFDALGETLRAYNSDDADRFGRERPCRLEGGPYYAVRSVGAMLLSRGGPEVDGLLRPVLHPAGTAVRGLHLIGEVLGMSQFSGDAFAGGMSVGPALTFGVLIADSVAAALEGDPQ